uniref:Putative CRISPR-associated Cse1 family protein n=1 Tax=Streptomyces sp. SANK 62799 TaxID=701528 RepID=E1CG17_9ACTN|nr:putative CRISPR-associated Cse1 family protein [Streptomyces sp. SANK 62799]
MRTPELSLNDTPAPIYADLRGLRCITALTIGPDQRKPPAVEKLTLLEVFQNAERITSLVHPTPGGRLVLHQLLLGLCYATGVHPRTPRQWRTWVTEGRSLAEVAERLATPEFDGRLDLAHPEQPFGQNAALAPFMEQHGYGTAQLEMHRAADYNQLFDHKHLYDPQPLSVEDALAAMLVEHAYGLGGRMRAKTNWLGPAFTYGSVGRLGSRISVLAIGTNLADTLRLNLTPTDTPGTFNFSWTDGKTRRDFRSTARQARTVDGPADLCSVLGRSVLMRPATTSDGRLVIDRVLVGAGELLDPLPPTHQQDAVMRGDWPWQARAERALWRDANAIYAAFTPRSDKGTDLYSRLLTIGRRVDLWAVGLIARQRDVTAWISDTFPFAPDHELTLRTASSQALACAEATAKAVRSAASVARDTLYPRARPEERTRLLQHLHPGTQLWARFEAPFRTLMDDLTAGAPHEHALATYTAAVTQAAHQALAERLRALPQTGTGLEAAVRAQARLERDLAKRTHPMPQGRTPAP